MRNRAASRQSDLTAPSARLRLLDPGAASGVAAHLGALALAVPVGVGVAAGHFAAAAIIALLPLGLIGAMSATAVTVTRPKAARTLGVMLLALVASTLVWRGRTTAQIDTNPLDWAAQVRILLLAGAALYALGVLVHTSRRPNFLPLSLKLLALYVAVALASALGSPQPLQALYFAAELVAVLVVAVAAVALVGSQAGHVMLRIVFGFIFVLVAIIWIEAAVFRQVWTPTPGVFPYTLEGYRPNFASNTVGLLGALLVIWNVGRFTSGVRNGAPRLLPLSVATLGFVTLLASQYRTGIVGLAFAAFAVLVLRRKARPAFAVMSIALVAALVIGWGTIVAGAEETFRKGQADEQVESVSGRLDYWKAAIPLIEERPVLGSGLKVGTRLTGTSIGLNLAGTHSTWVDALLGTGVVGASILALAFLAALAFSGRQAFLRRDDPLLATCFALLCLLFVRSLTSSSIETFDVTFVIFVAAVVAVAERSRPQSQHAIRTPAATAPAVSRA